MDVASDLDPAVLLAAYDAQLRVHLGERLPPGVTVEVDGPVIRAIGLDHRGFVTYRSVADLAPAELDALIARQRDLFAARGEGVEWKYHGHDQPADLPDRLRAAGFVPEDRETVVIGLAEPLLAGRSTLPPEVRLRAVTSRADLDRIAAMESAVWNADRGYLPDGITVMVAEAGDEVVSAGWVRYVRGTPFATLWGGSTLPAWRRRGIYRALVADRARRAVERGYLYLQVDASDNSRPILQRLGFVAVTTTTPYVHEVDGSAQ
jgi:GNAT superfamily N-acetyltransferase